MQQQQSGDALEHQDQPLELYSEISARPAWDIKSLCIMLGLPKSTLYLEMSKHPAPLFLLGRRRYIMQEDALQWLQNVAKANSHTQRKNTRKAGQS